MFDFSFSELGLIGVVALVVIGPERLPRVARTAGVVLGRVQRYAATVRADIEREVELSEVRRVQGELASAARALESGMRDSLAAVESELQTSRNAVMAGPSADPLPLDEAAPTAGPGLPAGLALTGSLAGAAASAPLPPPASTHGQIAATGAMGWERLLPPAATQTRLPPARPGDRP